MFYATNTHDRSLLFHDTIKISTETLFTSLYLTLMQRARGYPFKFSFYYIIRCSTIIIRVYHMLQQRACLKMADSLQSMNGSIYSPACELTDIRLDEFSMNLTRKRDADRVL